ncbi:uncharacterized protein LOC119988083 [Tripterygium wilfordii]|uniref:uncharacterized protein LOC119988083 n=1 Tax=Tripterygium wilfordii TaxID=458696 RepID=UPI0018F7F234|nr:uncharacterized protein LOC119988083 [Tripterygium wilfordii]
MASATVMVLVAFCVPLISIMIIGELSSARELRPSNHGLQNQGFQQLAPEESPEMKEFFRASSPDVALPSAMNSYNSTPWTIGDGGGDGGGGKDHVRHVLVVASLVCGVIGVTLLVASILIYLFRFKLNRPKT